MGSDKIRSYPWGISVGLKNLTFVHHVFQTTKFGGKDGIQTRAGLRRPHDLDDEQVIKRHQQGQAKRWKSAQYLANASADIFDNETVGSMSGQAGIISAHDLKPGLN